MAWNDEITEATYTSPKGKSYVFKYGEAVSKNTDLKTVVSPSTKKGKILVQSFGISGRTFPLDCYFFGENCFTEATAFEDALCERGYGELQHPVYGVRKVVPTGSIGRSDNLVSDLNQSIVNITFTETVIDKTSPISTVVSKDKISDDFDAFSETAAQEFAKDMNLENVSESIKAKEVMKDQARIIKDSLSDIAKKDPSVWAEFQTIFANLENSLDDFINNKLTVARQIIRLTKLPGRISTRALAKIEGYTYMMSEIMRVYTKNPIGIGNVENQFIATRLTLETAITSIVSGVALTAEEGVTSTAKEGGAFFSRSDAVESATTLLEFFDKIIVFCDDKIEKNLFVDIAEGYEQMYKVVSGGTQFIIDSSFSLPTQRIIRLGRDRNIIELLTELYGNVNRIDEFIVDNNLTIDDIEILSMGKEVKYYV